MNDQLDAIWLANTVDNPVDPIERLGRRTDPLQVDIPDNELVRIIDRRIDESHTFFKEKYDLYERRKKNELYLFGRQIKDKEDKNELKSYESRYLDNAIYEIEASIKPLALSRMPDMMVLPGEETPEQQDDAETLTEVVNSDIKQRQNRIVLSIAFKHLPVYFTGIIKARWNPEISDYEFITVHPDLVEVDHTARSNDANKMRFISEIIPTTVQDVLIRFPKKKEEFLRRLEEDGIVKEGIAEWKSMATPIQIREVWFTEYRKKEEEPTEQAAGVKTEAEAKYERIEGVLWKYKDVILDKMRDPNFDHEGETKYFTYDNPALEETKREIGEEDVMQMVMTGQLPQMDKEQVYRNFFSTPQKPYFFMGYDQWHKIPYDETSRLEQNIRNQEALDTQGKQIMEELKDRGKHVWSKDGGLESKDLEEMDMSDPNQDVLVDGNVSYTHKFIEPVRPSSQEFTNIELTRKRMFSLAGATNLSGELQTDVATSNQIAREANYTRTDDLVEETINAAAEWMAGFVMQFIKLRYTEDHMRRIVGDKGRAIFLKLRHDMITDGMFVTIKASGTDKLKRQKNALEMAGMQLIDPLTFFEDMDLSDPEGRAEKLMTFQIDPATYLMKYVKNMDTPEQIQALGAAPGAPTPEGAPTDVMGPTPTDTQEIPTEPPVGVQASPQV